MLLFRRCDGPQHQWMRHFQRGRVRKQVLIDPTGKNSGFPLLAFTVVEVFSSSGPDQNVWRESHPRPGSFHCHSARNN